MGVRVNAHAYNETSTEGFPAALIPKALSGTKDAVAFCCPDPENKADEPGAGREGGGEGGGHDLGKTSPASMCAPGNKTDKGYTRAERWGPRHLFISVL